METEPREYWLDLALSHLFANADGLRDGVLSQASLLLRGLECGEIPCPFLFVTGDRCYAIQWENVAGCRLSITVVGQGIWRYAFRKGRKSSGLQTVRGDHVIKMRRLLEKLFPDVNNGCYLTIGWELNPEGELS